MDEEQKFLFFRGKYNVFGGENMIKGLEKGKPVILIRCYCGQEYESRYIRGQLKKFVQEFNEYENHNSEPCPECGKAIVINLNLPAEELEDAFFKEVDMPEEERQERRAIKDFKTELTFEER